MLLYSSKIRRCPPYIMLLIWFGIAIHLYLPNMGGMGLALPQNIISWGAMALLSLVIWLSILFNKQRIIITPTMKLFFVASALLAVPLLYTRPEWLEAASWRLAGLFGGLIFYFSWLQVSTSSRLRLGVLYGLLFAISVQALLALLQLFSPDLSWVAFKGGRVYGVFQQANVLASFIATGVALALMLFLLPCFALAQTWHERWRQRTLAMLLVLFSALLVWIQSRVGWLGGVLVALLFCGAYGRKLPGRCAAAMGLILIGALLGVAIMTSGWGGDAGFAYVSHSHSNQARYTMLRDTLTMITEKPWSGWGYGGFEYSFMHFRITQTPPTIITEIASHPHNELLLWWLEGGVIALAGVGVLLIGGSLLLRRLWRYEARVNKAGSANQGEALALCFVLLPIALHTQTEYPFYLSALHWAVFLLLLAMLDRLVTPASERGALTGVGRKTLVILLPIVSLITLLVMLVGLLGGITLTRAEQNKFMDMREVAAMPPVASWVQSERREFDQQVYALLLFNQTQDEALLSGYANWANGYLKKRIDRNVYASLYLILKHQGNSTQAKRLRREAIAFFPDDPRFM
ncbi:Wzy polymerase domain-containing protein [Serratia plymuthica]